MLNGDGKALKSDGEAYEGERKAARDEGRT